MTTSSPLIDPEACIGELVADVPARAAVLDDLGVDYARGGQQTLGAVAAQADIDHERLSRRLITVDGDVPVERLDWSRVSLERLAKQLEREHTTFLSDLYLPIQGLFEKVTLQHAGEHPELVGICDRFTALENSFVECFDEEEATLFPACQAVIAGDTATVAAALDEVNRLRGAAQDQLGEFAALRMELEDVDLAPDASEEWTTLTTHVVAAETALRRHVHCESYILPRCISARAAASAG